jgi:hypothetical protein
MLDPVVAGVDDAVEALFALLPHAEAPMTRIEASAMVVIERFM